MVDVSEFLNNQTGKDGDPKTVFGYSIVKPGNPVQWLSVALGVVGGFWTGIWTGLIEIAQAVLDQPVRILRGIADWLVNLVYTWIGVATTRIDELEIPTEILGSAGPLSWVMAVVFAIVILYGAMAVIRQLSGGGGLG